jgi:hypothetical protein
MTDNFERALEERLLARSEVSSRDVEALRHFARTVPARRSIRGFWQRPMLQLGLSAAAVALVAVITLPFLSRNWGFGVGSPTPATPTPSAPITTPAPTPIVPQPTVAPPVVVPFPTFAPGWTAMDVVLDDPDGAVTASSAAKHDGVMSIRWFESDVEQLKANSFRITYAAYPEEANVEVKVTYVSGGLHVEITQKSPPLNSDALGEDRVLMLELTKDLAAADVEVTFQAR